METREEYSVDLFLLIPLSSQVAAQDLKPTFSFPDLFPEVGRLVTIAYWIARAAVLAAWIAALIEGKEKCLEALELRGHLDFPIAYSEVDKGSTWETEKWFRLLPRSFRLSVFLVLIDRVFDRLSVVGL